MSNDHDAVSELLGAGANVNASATGDDKDQSYSAIFSPRLGTALHWAAFHGNSRMVELLLESEGDVEAKDNRGWTPLYWAVFKNQAKTLQLLIDSGAQVNFKEWSPLHLAANSDDPTVLRVLLNAGADPLARAENDGRTPTDVAFSPELIHCLIDAIPEIDTEDDHGRTVLCKEASYKCRPDVIQLLLSKGATVEARDKRGETPLYKAVSLRKPEAVTVLLAAGADINATNFSGMTPLDLVELQLKYPTKGRWEDNEGMAKRLERDRELVRFLRKHGATTKTIPQNKALHSDAVNRARER